MTTRNVYSSLDLNLDNYSLDDLLSLFKIDNIANQNDMSRAQSIVLKMHPDKSDLDKEYFLFFINNKQVVFIIISLKL